MTETQPSHRSNRSPSAENRATSSRRNSSDPSDEHTQETEHRPDKEEEEEEKQDNPEESTKPPSHSPDPAPSDPSNPPLPDEELPPPLPDEAPPDQEDDGWEPVWDAHSQAYYFYNRFTGVSQWENPRVPDATAGGPAAEPKPKPKPVEGGYNPAIHGDYDPTAPYAQLYEKQDEDTAPAPGVGTGVGDPAAAYTAAGQFNRFTGRWQAMSVTPENYNDENKARRQMNAFFDVDAAANSHNGRSLRAERSAKKLSRNELKMFKEKRREKKEEKRRAWLRD